MSHVAQASAAARGRQRSLRRPSSQLLVIVALFSAAAVISAFTMLRDVDPFDEGLTLQAARRVAAGQVPYRDFLWAYGPLQPYLLAGLIKLFGVSLLPWRILRMLADAGVALAAYLLVRGRVPRPLALAVWLAVACAMAEPRSANPFPFALLAVLLALRLSTGQRRLSAAVVLTAVAAAFRLDFALYGLVAVTVAIALEERTAGPALRYAIGAAGLIALVYLPFAILDGPGALYDALIGTSLRTGGSWRLPFPLHYHSAAHAGLAQNLKHGLDFYIPLLLVLALALAVVWLLARRRWPSGLLGGAVVIGLGALAYLVSRADDFHAQPLFVIVAIMLALMAVGAPRALAIAALVLLALLLAHGVANRASALVRPPAESAIHVPVADGAQAPPREARAIERLVALVDARVAPGRPIYVLPRRSDLVRISDPLIYVLTERVNPTRQDFGLLTGAAAQRRIVASLARVKPRIVVRWTDPISSQAEPNSRGRSSGVRILDRWVSDHYRLLGRLYHYDVLIAR